MTTTMPHMTEDGSHVFPVSALQWKGGQPFEASSGEIRWNVLDGVTFRFELPAPSGLSSLGPTSSKAAGGSGSLHPVEASPEWSGKLGDGSDVHLLGAMAQETGQVTTSMTGSSAKRVVSGTAMYAQVTLSKEQEIAFWYATETVERLHFLDLVLSASVWPIREDVEYTEGDASISAGRSRLPLSSEPPLALVRGPQCKGIWLTYRASGTADPLWYDRECEVVRGFVSLLTGRCAPFVWKDTFAGPDHLTRLYHGWHRRKTKRAGNEQPIPICGGTEALTHGAAIGKEISALFARFIQIRPSYDLEWIASPLWSAHEGFIDDSLAFCCISLERFAAAHGDVLKKRPAADAAFLSKEDAKELKKRLKEVLTGFSAERAIPAEVKTVFERRIDSIHQTPNANIYKKVFADLGVALSAQELDAINNRNICFHGRPTMPDVKRPGAVEQELLNFDTLRTLIHRGVLSLLGYKGPYVDYAARPAEGNYPLGYL